MHTLGCRFKNLDSIHEKIKFRPKVITQSKHFRFLLDIAVGILKLKNIKQYYLLYYTAVKLGHLR